MQSDILWKAAVLTITVFIAGIGIGVWLDSQRVGQTRTQLTELDLQWNDARLTSLYYQLRASTDPKFCESAINTNLDFNQRIYQQGQIIERFEAVNRFAPELMQEKKRYALLQLQFWLNSIALKQSCNASYHTLAYFYSYYDEELSAVQKAQSSVLLEIKEKCGSSLMLVPLPLDINVTTIDLIAERHGIASAPSLLLDEGTVLSGLKSKPDLEKLLPCSS